MNNTIYTTYTNTRKNRTQATLTEHIDHFSEITYDKEVGALLTRTSSYYYKTYDMFVDFVKRYAQNEFAYTFKRKSYYFNELPAQLKANIRYFLKLNH